MALKEVEENEPMDDTDIAESDSGTNNVADKGRTKQLLETTAAGKVLHKCGKKPSVSLSSILMVLVSA